MKERYVKEVDVSLVKFNNENPRQIFDQEAEDKLYFSIKRKGVLVPILVCSDNGKFLLIDGERRVRASIRTGLNKIPANIIEKDSPLEYATKMFHIHNLGVGWRLMATALELQKLKELSKTSKEKELSSLTGLSVVKVRQCNNLLNYPEKFRETILEQEALPKSERKRIGKEKILSDHFFIELSSALNILKRFEPKIFNEFGQDKIINLFIRKRKDGNLKNVTLFRDFKKIIGLKNKKGREIIKNILNKETYTIENGFKESGLQTAFLENKFYKQSALYLDNLGNVKINKNSKNMIHILNKIRGKIEEILQEK